MNAQIRNSTVWLVALLLFASVFLLTGLGSNQLIDWDENIYAEASRQMLLRGDYLNIYTNNMKITEKPPFFFWEQVLSFKLFGVNEFAARLPSVVAGIMMVLLCFFVGSKIKSRKLGLIWGTVFLTCLLPSALARASAIEHTFNLFIAAAAFSLYLYDQRYRQYLEVKGRKHTPSSKFPYFRYLIISSIFLGLASLTKTPLGSVISLVAFGSYKLFNRKPAIHIGHFVFCAFISLSIALSWYFTNWITSGEDFITGFIQFQLDVFGKSLQGHEGPFYYHFVVALIGLLPWTAFLFAFKPKAVFSLNSHFKALCALCLGWVVFVLVLTSFVSTKLPHYSASVYIPLSLLVAMVLYQRLEENEGFSWRIVLPFAVLGGLLAAFSMAVPYLADEFLQREQIAFKFIWSNGLYIAGVAMVVTCLAAAFAFWKRKLIMGIILTAMLMVVFTQNLWQFLIPPFLSYNQQPLLEMVDEAHEKDGKVAFYRFMSYAALFYGRKPIAMVHADRFYSDPKILTRHHEYDLYVISDLSYKNRLMKEYPLVEHIRDKGTFSFFIIKKE